jgi:hypothetical protein
MHAYDRRARTPALVTHADAPVADQQPLHG